MDLEKIPATSIKKSWVEKEIIIQTSAGVGMYFDPGFAIRFCASVPFFNLTEAQVKGVHEYFCGLIIVSQITESSDFFYTLINFPAQWEKEYTSAILHSGVLKVYKQVISQMLLWGALSINDLYI